MWFEIMEYNDNKAMTVTNLVETTCLVQYTWQVKIMYNLGRELLGPNFKSILIDQVYGN